MKICSKLSLVVLLAGGLVFAFSAAPARAQDKTPEKATEKGGEKAKEGDKIDEKETLPESDPKAEALLKEAWLRIDSITTQEEEPLTKIAALSKTTVDFSDVPEGYKVSRWSEKAVEGVFVDARVAWVSHEEFFSMHVLDGKKEGEEKAGDWSSMGVKRAIGGGQIKIGFALPYLMGLRHFETEFRAHTFTMAEAPHKDWQVVTAWYHLKGRKYSKVYYIDDKGKGYIRYFTALAKLHTFELEKAKKKQMIITGLTIQPAEAGLAKILFDPKEAKKKAQEDKKSEDPYEPRFDDTIEWYGFGKRQAVVGKKTEMALTVTTWLDYERRRIPVMTSLTEVATNDKATEEMIKGAGFGGNAGSMPAPTYKDKGGAESGDGDKKEEKKE